MNKKKDMAIEPALRSAADALAVGGRVDWLYLKGLCEAQIIYECHIRRLDIGRSFTSLDRVFSHISMANIQIVMMLFDPEERQAASLEWANMSFWDLIRRKGALQNKIAAAKARIMFSRMDIMKSLFKQSEFPTSICNMHVFVTSPSFGKICFGYIELDWLLYSEHLIRAIGEHFVTTDEMEKLWRDHDDPWTVDVHISHPSKYHTAKTYDQKLFTTIGIDTDAGYRPIHHIIKTPIYECGSV